MTDPLRLVKDGIKAALLANGDLARYVGTRIYHFQSPPGTPMDCVEYRLTAGGEENSSPRKATETVWEIYGVSTNEDHAFAIAEAVYDTMTRNSLQIPGWDCFVTFAQDWLIRKVWIEGESYWMVGKFYQFRTVKRD